MWTKRWLIRKPLLCRCRVFHLPRCSQPKWCLSLYLRQPRRHTGIAASPTGLWRSNMFGWLFDHIVTSVELFFAGAWSSAWHKGVLYGVIFLSVALAFGSQFLAIIPLIGPG